jgi:methionyl aminopeptidase
MIDLKNEKQLKDMVTGGHMLAETLFTVIAAVRPGMTELELDAMADRLILEKGGRPGFKLVPGYHHATCMATNDVVVHGIPSEYRFKDGDIVNVDCGVYYHDLHTDMAETIVLGKGTPEVRKFLETGKRALEAAIAQAKPGNRIGHISKAIQDIVEKEAGYSVVRELIGHGVGKELHEDPEVPGYLTGKIERTPELVPGMTIAIEVIYAMGRPEVVYKGNDGWSIATADGSLSAVFERTIAITKDGHQVLTV